MSIKMFNPDVDLLEDSNMKVLSIPRKFKKYVAIVQKITKDELKLFKNMFKDAYIISLTVFSSEKQWVDKWIEYFE